MMHNYGFGHGYGFMGVGLLFQILILFLFFAVIWWLVKNSGQFGFKCKKDESALNILKKRLARGEITEEQFKKLRKEIE